MCPNFLLSARLSFGTIEDRLPVQERSHASNEVAQLIRFRYHRKHGAPPATYTLKLIGSYEQSSCELQEEKGGMAGGGKSSRSTSSATEERNEESLMPFTGSGCLKLD
jgi:hypothetical protein